MKKGKRFLSNRLAYTLIIIGILIIVAVGVYAANSLLTPGVAPNPGHTISQTAPPSACSAGQVLQWTGASNVDGGWACVDQSSSQQQPDRFGGFYSFGENYNNYPYASCLSTCQVSNPYTGDCSCPSGYTSIQLTGPSLYGSGQCVNYCYR